MWPFNDNSWKEIANNSQAKRQELISAVESNGSLIPSAQHDEILKSTASEIVAAIGQGTWTAKQVVSAFITRAIQAHRETNCFTEILFESALREAEEWDREFANTKELKGPLHGVPITFKDQFEIAGYDATLGFTRWVGRTATEDAEVVKQIRAAGGIIIGKTNIPQTMMSFECSNPLWGRTTNPWNKDYTCGGSSGGEGAVLACDGSVIGIGSDIGGSLRIPAHFCGVYSLKPTARRVSAAGARGREGVPKTINSFGFDILFTGAVPGFQNLTLVIGSMARSVADLKITSKLLFGASDPYTPQAYPPVPYRETKLPSKLKFGYYLSDGCVKTSPASQRAVLETVSALKRQGHECIEFTPPEVLKALGIFGGLTAADGYQTLRSDLGPDPQEKSLFLITLSPALPSFVRWLARRLISVFKPDPIFSEVLKQFRVRTTKEEWAVLYQKELYVEMFYKEVWEKHSFDGIIAPVQAGPALPHGGTATLTPLACATLLYNVVDSPIGVLPVTRVDPARDAIDDKWLAGPGRGSPILEEDLYFGPKAVYDVEKMAGLPVGVQIIGRAWEDEKVLEMLNLVDRALGPRGLGPGAWIPNARSA